MGPLWVQLLDMGLLERNVVDLWAYRQHYIVALITAENRIFL